MDLLVAIAAVFGNAVPAGTGAGIIPSLEGKCKRDPGTLIWQARVLDNLRRIN
jgi:hypothetical protein